MQHLTKCRAYYQNMHRNCCGCINLWMLESILVNLNCNIYKLQDKTLTDTHFSQNSHKPVKWRLITPSPSNAGDIKDGCKNKLDINQEN